MVATSHSFPAASASVHHAGAKSSRTRWPPAASAAAIRVCASSYGTHTQMWIAPPPSVSKHLKVLERAGLVTRGREAQWRPCALEAGPLKEVDDWIERYRDMWEERLD